MEVRRKKETYCSSENEICVEEDGCYERECRSSMNMSEQQEIECVLRQKNNRQSYCEKLELPPQT